MDGVIRGKQLGVSWDSLSCVVPLPGIQRTEYHIVGHLLLLTPPLSHGELGMNCILLATSFRSVTLTSRVKSFGSVVGAERLRTQFYFSV